MSTYQTTVQHGTSRTGALQIDAYNATLTTPRLYLLIPLINGRTIFSGGCQKHVMRLLGEHDEPFVSSTLSFLGVDFSAADLVKCRKHTIKDWYDKEGLPFQSPLFLDSGGYQLLYNTQLDLSDYGIRDAYDIFSLQTDWGADIISSLDYPISLNLRRDEALERIELNLKNAFQASHLAANHPDTFLYIYCHGQTPEDFISYVRRVFEQCSPVLPSFGLALNSLKFGRDLDCTHLFNTLQAVRQAIPDEHKATTPIHVFGVPTKVTPILAYLGADSFEDMSYYHIMCRYNYIMPDTHIQTNIDTLIRWDCTCRYCSELTLDKLFDTLKDSKRNRRTSTGLYRIECYALIALHNFEMKQSLLKDMQDATLAAQPLESLLQYVDTQTRINDAIAWLTQHDKAFAKRYARTMFSGSQLTLFDEPAEPRRTKSLNYTPNSFQLDNNYQPPSDKKVLLILPCAKDKPYSQSKVYTNINNPLKKEYGHRWHQIHQVTLSGLYGPVPEEFEMLSEVLDYDFLLDRTNTKQLDLLTNRLDDYIARYSDCYELCIGYCRFTTYRKAFEQVASKHKSFELVPDSAKSVGIRSPNYSYYVYADQLIEKINAVIF